MSDAPGTDPDVEDRRIDELVTAQARGTATEAEREELALYVEQRPELVGRVEDAARKAQLGQGWLDRVERDELVQQAERSPRVRVERGLGLGLVTLGFVLSLFAPVASVPVLGMGTLLLLYSIVRVRLATHRVDPYKDVMR